MSIHGPIQAPRVAVITVSYGSGEVLEGFLKSFRRYHDGAVPVVVVDNKPDHENVRELAEKFGSFYLPLPENPGYGAGMNAGVTQLPDGFDTYFFCNPDVRFIEESTTALSNVLLSNGKFGSIGPRVLNEDGSIYSSARNTPSVSTGIGHAIFGKPWPNNPWSRAYTAAADYSSARAAGWLSGAAVMVRADLFHRLNGWDDGYFMYFEDVDLGWKIQKAGFTNLYEPSVKVVHSGAHSTKTRPQFVEAALTESSIRFITKRYPGLRFAPLRALLILGLRLRGWVRRKAAG